MISCSPERLVQLEKGREAIYRVSTRPIAGTRSRGATPKQDIQLAQDLLSNTKERAEHIMLVDLERNDLGRVCEWGSVAVDELLTIERYSHVMHLVSNVKGTLKSTSTPSPPSLNTVWGQVGAGIVADSNPEREWYESLHKAQAQLQALLMQK